VKDVKSVLGTILGAVVGVLWVTLGGGAVLVVIALSGVGGLIGVVLDRPEIAISWLERLRDR